MPLNPPLFIIETQPVVEGMTEILHGLECRARRHAENPEFGLILPAKGEGAN
jgi:hypothetical protein